MAWSGCGVGVGRMWRSMVWHERAVGGRHVIDECPMSAQWPFCVLSLGTPWANKVWHIHGCCGVIAFGEILVIDAGRESVCNEVVRNCVPMLFITLSSEKETVSRDVQPRNTLSSITEMFAGM